MTYGRGGRFKCTILMNGIEDSPRLTKIYCLRRPFNDPDPRHTWSSIPFIYIIYIIYLSLSLFPSAASYLRPFRYIQRHYSKLD